MSVLKTTEIERKYAVPPGAVIPPLATLSAVAEVEADPVVSLDAVYVDTADRTLLAARIAVRRRTGGHDAGWHVKLPGIGGRLELQAPIDPESPEVLPAAFEVALRSRVRGRALIPIALVRTERRAIVVRGDRGAAVEVVDDLVTATDVAAGVLRSWREWEAEQVGDPTASSALLDIVDAALLEAGATESDSPAKLAQALGLVGAAPAPAPARPSTAGGVLAAAVAGHAEALHRGVQVLALDGDPDGTVIHGLRKSIRAIRALLALNPVAGAAGTVVGDGLAALGTALGTARDPLVQADIAERLLARVASSAPGLAGARALLIDDPRAAIEAATAAAVAAFGTPSAFDALAALAGYVPDGRDTGAKPKALVALGERTVRRAQQRARGVGTADIEQQHRARKAAKRARFVVEELVALGLVQPKSKLAESGRRAQALQDSLGDLRDLELLAERLPELADRLTRSGGNAYTLGWLAHAGQSDARALQRAAAKASRRFR